MLKSQIISDFKIFIQCDTFLRRIGVTEEDKTPLQEQWQEYVQRLFDAGDINKRQYNKYYNESLKQALS